MKVLLVNGSPRPDGNTAASLKIARRVLEDKGIETLWYQLPAAKVRGCIHCNRCSKTFRCVFEDDDCNWLIDQIHKADGVLIGTPVYFAGPNGALCALLDRVFYAGANFGSLFTDTPAAAIATCWRAGSTAAIDRLNKYFTFSQMPVVSSHYWNMTLNGTDPYGEDIVRQLAENMAREIQYRQKDSHS